MDTLTNLKNNGEKKKERKRNKMATSMISNYHMQPGFATKG